MDGPVSLPNASVVLYDVHYVGSLCCSVGQQIGRGCAPLPLLGWLVAADMLMSGACGSVGLSTLGF